jgi:hypothetical protein
MYGTKSDSNKVRGQIETELLPKWLIIIAK